MIEMKCHPFQGKLSGVELTTGLNQTKNSQRKPFSFYQKGTKRPLRFNIL